jgi:hypothetical protein
MKHPDTNSFNLLPRIDPEISNAIAAAWAAGEIAIFHAGNYGGQLPKPGHEWWRIDWIQKEKNPSEVGDSVMYAGAFEMKTEFRQKELHSNEDKINGFLLIQLALDFQRDQNRKVKFN